MGGQVDATEDMFAKLESMRAVITEVNTQFKDPVCTIWNILNCFITHSFDDVGKNHFRLRLHLRIPVTLRNRAPGTRINDIRNRYTQHRRQPALVPQRK